jgi:hypothetical protein
MPADGLDDRAPVPWVVRPSPTAVVVLKQSRPRSVEEIALRRTGAERHAAPGVPAATDGERVRLEQVRVADAAVARVAYVMCVEPDLLGHESK